VAEKKEEKKAVVLEEKEEKKLSNKNKKFDGNVKKQVEFKGETKKVEEKKEDKKEEKASEKKEGKDEKKEGKGEKKADGEEKKEEAEEEEKKKDPIPATPIQKANPNYCTYKRKADGTPHPDACKCIYVKNEDGKCVQLTDDCMPADAPPADC